MATWEIAKTLATGANPAWWQVIKVDGLSTAAPAPISWAVASVVGVSSIDSHWSVLGVAASSVETSTDINWYLTDVVAEALPDSKHELYYWNGAQWLHCELNIYEGDNFWNPL